MSNDSVGPSFVILPGSLFTHFPISHVSLLTIYLVQSSLAGAKLFLAASTCTWTSIDVRLAALIDDLLSALIDVLLAALNDVLLAALIDVLLAGDSGSANHRILGVPCKNM